MLARKFRHTDREERLMRIIAIPVIVVLLSASLAGAESFTLRSDSSGEVAGPFPYEDGARVAIDGSTFTLETAVEPGDEDAVWKEDLADTNIPNRPAKGMIHGIPFTVEKAYVQNGILHLMLKEGPSAHLGFTIFMFLEEGAAPDRLRFYLGTVNRSCPHVYMRYPVEGQKLPGKETFTKNYAMKLEFGESENGEVPGRIYLCLPDEEKSFVAGTFTADVK
jgi:hypothetical protein